MANTRMIFYGSYSSKTDDHELECYHNIDNQIYISINVPEIEPCWIVLDIPTAIKLAKTLRTEINNAKEI